MFDKYEVSSLLGYDDTQCNKAKLALKAINRFPVSESNDLLKASENINPATKRLDNNY